MKTSSWSRAQHLLKLAGEIALKESGSRLKQVFRADATARLRAQVGQARTLVQNLGALKGAAMKAGQMAALELRDFLPPEVVMVLSELQSHAPPLPYPEIEKVLLSELGTDCIRGFDWISPDAFAAASIGQVHRARRPGPDGAPLELVLKIQFPGVREAIDSDLRMLGTLAKSALRLSSKEADLNPVLEEIREVLIQETDYELELKSLDAFSARLKSPQVPQKLNVRVPKVYPEWSTQRVLAMSYEEGVSLDEWCALGATPELKNAVAENLLSLYFLEFFEWGLVQTDPNLGNFLFTPGSSEITLLDFGATRTYPPEFRARYREFLKAARARNRSETLRLAQGLELLDSREDAEAQDAFLALIESVIRVFDPDLQPFSFSDDEILNETRSRLIALVRAIRYSPPPRPFLFLHRKLGGISSMIRTLSKSGPGEVQVNLENYWSSLFLN